MELMTVDKVAEAVKHFLSQEPVPDTASCPEMMLQGTPDEQLGKLLEAKGGVIRIIIRSVPAELMSMIEQELSGPVNNNPYCSATKQLEAVSQ